MINTNIINADALMLVIAELDRDSDSLGKRYSRELDQDTPKQTTLDFLRAEIEKKNRQIEVLNELAKLPLDIMIKVKNSLDALRDNDSDLHGIDIPVRFTDKVDYSHIGRLNEIDYYV